MLLTTAAPLLWLRHVRVERPTLLERIMLHAIVWHMGEAMKNNWEWGLMSWTIGCILVSLKIWLFLLLYFLLLLHFTGIFHHQRSVSKLQNTQESHFTKSEVMVVKIIYLKKKKKSFNSQRNFFKDLKERRKCYCYYYLVLFFVLLCFVMFLITGETQGQLK